LTELDAAKINGHFNNQNNNTTSVSNNHHFVNPSRPNITSSLINADYTSTLSSGTIRSGISCNSRLNNDFNNYKISRSNNNIEFNNDDILPISSRSDAFQNINQDRDIFKHPNPRKTSQLDNNENSPSTVSFSFKKLIFNKT
jgi:hypothetical protein